MQLPDEAVVYDHQGLLIQAEEEWGPAAELRERHFVSPSQLRDLTGRILQLRSQVAAEREIVQVPADRQAPQAGFISLPEKLLEQFRRQGDASLLGRILERANRLREEVDRVVVLGGNGSTLAARALFQGLRSTLHNELPDDIRLGVPRFYFDGDSFDNDTLQQLLDLLQTTCVDPELREERWGVVTIDAGGYPAETGTAYRIFRREAAEFYGSRSDRLRQLFQPISPDSGSFHELLLAEGYREADILTLPPDVGHHFTAFTAAGLFPAALMGLDIRALLLGAATMTRRFLEEPFERNPVLQFAAVNHIMSESRYKYVRAFVVWSKRLETLGHWYEQLASGVLGRQSIGPSPTTLVGNRDLEPRGNHLLEGRRNAIINHLLVRNATSAPLGVGMADNNQDQLNAISRKSLSDLNAAAHESACRTYADAARPTADLVLPTLSEHTLGQVMQLLMLATVLEARLMGISPYGRPTTGVLQRNFQSRLQN